MSNHLANGNLLLSLQRALLGEVHPHLRQASGELDAHVHLVRLRFEYDGQANAAAHESCSCAAAEVIADFPAPWRLDEQHIARPATVPLEPLTHVAYRRWEREHAT